MLSFFRSLLLIFSVTFAISGSGVFLFWGFRHMMLAKEKDPQYELRFIQQEALEGDPFRTIQLGQFLEINNSSHLNLYRFNTTKAATTLLETSLFRSISIWKRFPDTLHIEYLPRIPFAYLGDYSNTAIDGEGYLFPMQPFYTPKRLPKIYFGLDPLPNGAKSYPWGGKLQGEKFALAKELIAYFENRERFPDTYLRSVDLSKTFSPRRSQRELVIEIEEQKNEHNNASPERTSCKRFLRLDSKNYAIQIDNYCKLARYIESKKNSLAIVDLRIEGLAYFKTNLSKEGEKG